MNIYQLFVFSDKLISPITGYTCKRITKQNIKQFGFASISELHNQYPEFPIMCPSYHYQVMQNSIKGGSALSIKSKTNTISKQQELKLDYMANPKICDRCGDTIPFDVRKNKYCSSACGHKRPQSNETCMKISTGIKSFNNKNPLFRKDVRQKHLKPIQETIVSCFCCNQILTINSKTYDNRKHKFFSCDKEQCKISVRKKVSSETGKKSATNRVKRSKLEIQLYNLCEKHYDVTHNQPIVDGWDADIIFNEYKIAVLWNGPWHYKNMNMTNHSLDQVVTRDCLKIQALENIGWTVLVYQDNQWTPETALVDIINHIRKIK